MIDTIRKGLPLSKAKQAIILIHGRGARAEGITSLASHLHLPDYAVIAPQARGGTWYPYGFMASDKGNRAALENSLEVIRQVRDEIVRAGIPADSIYLLGFSQGACLSLEFAARKAHRMGGVVAFTGGLIGEKLHPEKYSGDFQQTPILISSSERDFHVPAVRIEESASLLRKMGADVAVKLFGDLVHTIRTEEVSWVNQKLFL